MPIRPPPYTLRCPSCGWRETYMPWSDSLMPSESPTECPTCESQPLIRGKPSDVDKLLAMATEPLKRWMK